MAVTFELGPTSGTAIQLYPEYDYAKKVIKNESNLRTKTGRQYIYQWGTYTEFKFSVEWVTAANAAIVNSWYQSNTELRLFITSSTATEVNSVRIQGKESPLAEYMKPYDNYYKGKLELTTY